MVVALSHGRPTAAAAAITAQIQPAEPLGPSALVHNAHNELFGAVDCVAVASQRAYALGHSARVRRHLDLAARLGLQPRDLLAAAPNYCKPQPPNKYILFQNKETKNDVVCGFFSCFSSKVENANLLCSL